MNGWDTKRIRTIDLRMVIVCCLLMVVSLLVIHATGEEAESGSFFTPLVKSQLMWFGLGSAIFTACVCFDYNYLREWNWILYFLMIVSLVGLFFVESIQNVHRWYKVPLIGASIQPSEFAKLIVVISLSWFLERRKSRSNAFSTAALAFLIVFIPFILILKQPDLGSALVLIPIILVIFYFGDVNKTVLKAGTSLVCVGFVFLALKFTGIIPHEALRPYATQIIKEYQYERLDPNTHHQKAAAIAIGVGGITGAGFKKSEFSGGGFLAAPYTDSVFASFGEEFGFLGIAALLTLFYALIYCSFQVVVTAKDYFGRLLACGISVYITMHVLINIGMMIGYLPITGVPLVLVTYGGSSVLSTMAALGILQSIYSRRFMF